MRPSVLRQWVVEQTALLDPPAGWQPDAGAALTRLHARMESIPPRAAWRGWLTRLMSVRLMSVTAAALVLGAVLVLPGARALAQQFWQYLTVRQVAFIRVNPWPEGVPSPKINLIGIPIPPLPARDVGEARWRVKYDPRLPRSGVLSGVPRLSTTFGLSAGMVVKAADLQLALRQAGVMDQTVPPQWDGAQLALHSSGIVIAEWPDIAMVQSLPLTLTAPSGFDFPAYSALVLRVLGVGPDEAQRLAQRMATVPAWLAPIDRHLRENTTIEEISLRSGPATLLQEPPTWHNSVVGRVTVIWSVPDRVYLLTGNLSRELTIAAANAVE
ncbi:MAG TPA: hypothetical protein VNY05_29715 [Candidatus Acidoferrales bacterium]|nr:hypothetical protein [Candidatus Acidoferrales bacterium]